MDDISNGPYQLLRKDPTSKIKFKTLKQIKALRDNKLIDNKLYCLKPTDLPVPILYGQPKMPKAEVPIYAIVSCSGSPLFSLNKYVANILKAYVKDENNDTNNSTTLSNYVRR